MSMPLFAASVSASVWGSRASHGALVACFVAATLFPVMSLAAPAKGSIPELGSRDFGWAANDWDFRPETPPGATHGPIRTDPRYPYDSQIGMGGMGVILVPIQVPIVDTKDPVLKPWAAMQMQATNDEVLSGERKLPFVAQSRCWPGGVPGQLLYLEPFYFLQTPKMVWMIWQRDHIVRRIHLTDKHSANVKPSWFGESIGHYENGDTLVVDTIGLSSKNSYIDSFRTPHTEKEHVVERFTISSDERSLTAAVTVEDPDTFNGPIAMTQIWRKADNPIGETICADDGGVDVFQHNLFPIPQADKPDF
jgi:hypothetical protein